MSARNFYIMQSAVEPMQSELPCYTPLTNHATDVHTVPMVFASHYKALRAANQRLEGEVERWHKLACSHSKAEDRLSAEVKRLEGEVARLREALDSADKLITSMCTALRGNGGGV
jgi:predicted nuclease with TOPRIM domain